MKIALPAAGLLLALTACASTPDEAPPADASAPKQEAPAEETPTDKAPASPQPSAAPAEEPAGPVDPSKKTRSSLAEPLPPSKKQNGPPLPRSMMFKAKQRTDRGLEIMEQAFVEKRRQRRIELFDLAIDQFEKATLLYYQRLQQPGAQTQVIDNQITRLKKFLDQCYSNRPLADE